MTLDITTPQLGKIKKTTKDLVISILVSHHNLTLTKLTNYIKKNFKVSVTFQGVRKAVNQLVENEVLIKKGKEYSLNKEWILKLRDFVEEVEESYFSGDSGIKEVESIGEEIKVYTFDNLIDLDKFWNRVIGKWFDEDAKNKRKKYYVQQSGHTWYVLGQLEEETDILDKIRKHNIHFYTFCVGNTVLDKWCKQYYNEQQFHYTTNKKKEDTSSYFAVYEDFVIQTTYPKKLAEEIDAVYQKTKNFQSFNAVELIKVLRKKTKLSVTVMKNPVIAKQLRNHILSKFT